MSYKIIPQPDDVVNNNEILIPEYLKMDDYDSNRDGVVDDSEALDGLTADMSAATENYILAIDGSNQIVPVDPTTLPHYHFKGNYADLAALQTAYPTANAGDYAYVNSIGTNVLTNKFNPPAFHALI